MDFAAIWCAYYWKNIKKILQLVLAARKWHQSFCITHILVKFQDAQKNLKKISSTHKNIPRYLVKTFFNRIKNEEVIAP